MLDSIYHMSLTLINNHILTSKREDFAIQKRCCYGPTYITLLNMQTTSGLSILLLGIISIQDARRHEITCDSFYRHIR